jgi:shikimate kinase
MPGAGKSCMGRIVSRKFKMSIIDGDKLIEKNTGRTLQDIIDEDGLEAFKDLERTTLMSIDEDNVIISPGGSAVYYDEVMEHFKKKGIVVYLYISLKTMKERVGDYSKRGIVLREGQTLDDLYLERAPLFEKYADVTVSCDGRAYSRYQAELVEKLKNYI